MRALVVLTSFLLTGFAAQAENPQMIPVSEQRGATYVAAGDLERAAGIAVKTLSSGRVAVCAQERCAPLKEFILKDDEIWVETAALARVLGLGIHFSGDRKQVRFEWTDQETAPDDMVARVGTLAPNFRLTTLDGERVSLADYRGKRVLIQSWASW